MFRAGSVLAIAAFLFWCAAADAQSSAYLYGHILDTSESVIPGATITLIDQGTGFRRATESQPDGAYMIASLRPGLYKITVRKDGFRTMIRFNERIGASQPARADFLLYVGDVQETVTVEGTAPLLNQEDASVGARIGADEIQSLPVNGGGVLDLLELTPGVTVTPATHGEAGQFTANGQRPNTHLFTVDGISANTGVIAGGLPAQAPGGSLPAMSAFGSLDPLIQLDGIDEVHVQTSTASADYGRLPGASVALTSRSGSNEFHGALLYRFRPGPLAANDWFANQSGEPRAAQHLDQGSASLGGPFWRNHTFFYANWETVRLDDPFVWRQAVPSAALIASAPAGARQALSLFPSANGPDLTPGLAEWNGQSTLPARLDSGSIRIDQAITPRATLFGRFNDSPSSNQFGSSQVNRLNFQSRGGTIGLNLRPSANIAIDLRINASATTAQSVWTAPGGSSAVTCQLDLFAAFYQAHCGDLVRFAIGGVGQVVSGNEGTRRQRQFETPGTLTWNLGPHAIRFGGEYLRIVPSRFDPNGALSVLADTAQDLVSTGNVWHGYSAPQTGSIMVQQASLWAQDTWRIGSRLTVNAGLRWEFSPAPTPANPVNFLDSTGTTVTAIRQPLWPESLYNLAPRFGLAWRLTSSGDTVLRAGAGVYYDSSISLATDALNGGPLNGGQFGSGRYAPINASLAFGFLPNLMLPIIREWNVSLEHAFTARDALTLTYAGSIGDRLIRREIGGPGSDQTNLLILATNHGESNYQSFQAQYRRRLSNGLEVRGAYAWSHSLDNSSSDALIAWAGAGTTPASDHASSDFDLRHTFTAAAMYGFHGWFLDAIVRARTGFPITVLQSDEFLGIGLSNAFRPNLTGAPVWLGGQLNPAAFQAAPYGTQGDLGRNAISGFGMWQADLALRHEFHVREKSTLQLRLEAFNAFNHPNFADPVRFLNSPFFGQSTSMLNLMLGSGSSGSGLAPLLESGGPRSVQATIRFQF